MPSSHEWEFLPYLQRFVRVLEQDFDGEPCGSPFYFPDDPDETTPIILELSLNQFTRLLSSVTKGSQLTYPMESDSVNWLLLKGVECPVDLCTIIQDCIGAQLTALSSRVDEIYDLANRNTAANQVAPPTAYTPTTPCDDSEAAGGCVAVTKYIEEYILDLMETTEASSPQDTLEEWALIIGAVPVFETLPIDELFTVVDWMFENQSEDFIAAIDATWRKETAEDLLCRVYNNQCVLTQEILAAWLKNQRVRAPSNIASEIFSRFGDATDAGIQNQVAQFLNQILNGKDTGTIVAFYDDLINAYRIGAKTPNFSLTLCSPDCDTTQQIAVPHPDGWLFDVFSQDYQASWVVLSPPNELTVQIGTAREISAVRVFVWSRYAPTGDYTCSINGGTPVVMNYTWQGWGIPSIAEAVFVTPENGDEIVLTFNVPYIAVRYVEWDSCPIP